MQQVIDELNQLTGAYAALFLAMDEATLSYKPGPEKWSKKEVIGHLVDSAQNNIQRFIRAQYETRPHIVYDQDQWVALQHYAVYDSATLIELWRLLNLHLCVILQHIPADSYDRSCNTGKQAEQLHTLSFLASDYIAHMKHHLEQIIML